MLNYVNLHSKSQVKDDADCGESKTETSTSALGQKSGNAAFRQHLKQTQVQGEQRWGGLGILSRTLSSGPGAGSCRSTARSSSRKSCSTNLWA